MRGADSAKNTVCKQHNKFLLTLQTDIRFLSLPTIKCDKIADTSFNLRVNKGRKLFGKRFDVGSESFCSTFLGPFQRYCVVKSIKKKYAKF